MTSSQSSRAVGDRVRYLRWVGRVYHVHSDGSMLIDFTGENPIFDEPFFKGPYRPEEISDAS